MSCDDEHKRERFPSRIRSVVAMQIQIGGEAAPTPVEPPIAKPTPKTCTMDRGKTQEVSNTRNFNREPENS
ncbi:hypothetical protein Ahy_B05g075125 isoform B [Arachis hypogaea]|uniref:Uncharacterized protein n=1 Tax=Arachis hypogaea TaxID=3818 RepID=A0A444Z0K4_ARAHY|nr:hypothetical protein Ahy_B05g075125 isoform B [Arachis hypogaea]